MTQLNLNIANPVQLFFVGAALSIPAISSAQANPMISPVALNQNTSLQNNYFLAKHMDTLKKRINSFKSLEDGWDGYGGEPPMEEVINNTLTFIQELPSPFVHLLQADNLYPTPYGTISIEWSRADDQFVSVEIGTEKLAYFYEILQNPGESPDNLDFSQKEYSQDIIAVLKELYHTELING
jgi:hypothetical protein